MTLGFFVFFVEGCVCGVLCMFFCGGFCLFIFGWWFFGVFLLVFLCGFFFFGGGGAGGILWFCGYCYCWFVSF